MCGIFGIQGSDQAAVYNQLGLHGLQHRGQESAGVATADGRDLHVHRAMGLVGDVFRQEVLDNLPGFAAIGHVRYSTTGDSTLANAQPLTVRCQHGAIAVVHNGNLVNAEELHRRFEKHGSIFQFTTDTEVILHLMARSRKKNLVHRIAEALTQVRGAYSLLFLTPRGELVAVRDPMGIRPLCFGRVDGAWVFSSEPVAFDIMDAEFIREVRPGEIIVAAPDEELEPHRGLLPKAREHFCVFEYIYFARPDSEINGRSVDGIRKELGRQLAREQPVEADIVIAVPDSGTSAALGYAEASRIPFIVGLTRSHYVGRTFIEPRQGIRHFGVKLKINPIRSVLRDKRVIIVDDSLVRATTSRKIVRMVKAAGASEVHLRISSPPNSWPCYYGIDTPNRGELVAASLTTEEIRRQVCADSLGYLSPRGMREAVGRGSICDACFTGNYPISVE
jgi:amidophosphoribosyltransferase